MPYLWPFGVKPVINVSPEARDHDEERLPMIIDGYKLSPILLGDGHYAVVFLGTHETTQEKVVVKVTYRDIPTAINYRKISMMVLCFKHPHIIKHYKTIITHQCVIDIMEHWSENDLSGYIPTNVDEARLLFQQLISAIDYCHRQMFIHRDIKLGNILVDADQNVKLIDFGLSAVKSEGNYLKLCCGTKHYWAPEIIWKRPYVGPEVDIYSAGETLYRLVSSAAKNEWGIDFACGLKDSIPQLPMHNAVIDLIRVMKTSNPVKRATMKDVKNHPWFKENLPEYLFPTERIESDWINVKILDEVSKKCKVSMQKVHTALLDNSLQSSELCTEYCLTRDNWRCDRLFAAIPIHWEFRIGPPKRDNPENKRKKRKRKVSGAHRRKSGEKLSPRKSDGKLRPNQPNEAEDKQMVFDRGLKFHVDYSLGTVLDVLYATLVRMDLEWKILHGYKWIVRRKNDPSKNPLKMILELCRTGSENYPHVICIRSLLYNETRGKHSVTETHHKIMDFLEESSLFYCQFYYNVQVIVPARDSLFSGFAKNLCCFL